MKALVLESHFNKVSGLQTSANGCFYLVNDAVGLL